MPAEVHFVAAGHEGQVRNKCSMEAAHLISQASPLLLRLLGFKRPRANNANKGKRPLNLGPPEQWDCSSTS